MGTLTALAETQNVPLSQGVCAAIHTQPSKGLCVCLILQALLVPFASNKPEQFMGSEKCLWWVSITELQQQAGHDREKRCLLCNGPHNTLTGYTQEHVLLQKHIQPALFKGFFLFLSEYHLPKAAKQKETEQPNKGMFVSYQQFVQQ